MVVIPFAPPATQQSGTLRRAITRTTYDANGNPLSVTNPRAFTTQFSYDSRNRKLTETRPSGFFLEWSYDAVGNVTRVYDARRNFTETFYDAANRPTKVVQAVVPIFAGGTARPTTLMTYDKNGNVESMTDPNGRTTINTYDALNRLLTTTDAEGIVVSNAYDPVGNLVAVVDGKNQRTTFAYDGINRNTRITDALGKATSYEFDPVNKSARIDANGQRTEYGYDPRHRLTTVNYVGRPQDSRALSYDPVGNLLTVTEATPAKNVAYSYDALGRQTTETSGGFTHTYRYDLAGNRISCTYGGSGLMLRSTYDSQNRLVSLTEGGNTSGYTYDPDGNVLTRILPNRDKTTSAYDAAGRTISLTGRTASDTLIYSYAYEYDTVGNVRRVTENYPDASQNRVVTNVYDAINRLTSESVSGSGATETTFAYDRAHNRASMSKAGVATTYTYNAANQLTSLTEGGRTVNFTYDNNGNRVTRTEGNFTDTFGWDLENRLIALTKQSTGGSGNYEWGYDYRTRRVSLATPGVSPTQVVFSGGTSVREIQNFVTTAEYVRGSDWGGGVGGILYSLRAGQRSFTHYNRRGDVTAKTSGNGTITYQAKYEAFGKRTSETGSTKDRQKSNTKDEDIPGYANEGFRFRDLETGTFISKDPLGFVDGPNLYTYVRQNPWTKFDPLGLREKTKEGVKPAEKTHHKVPVSQWDKYGMPKAVQEAWNEGNSVVGTKSGSESHNYGGHGEYNKRVEGELQKYIKENGNPSGLSAKQQKEWADNFVNQLDNTQDKYIKGFNGVVGDGRSAVKNWAGKEGAAIVKAESTLLKKLGKVGGEIAEHGGRLLKVAGVLMTVSEFAETAQAEGLGPATVDAVQQTINPIGLSQREMNQMQRQAYEGFWDKLTEGVYDNDQKDQWNTYPSDK